MIDHCIKPGIESNWGRIVLYLFVCLIAVALFSMPAVLFFWDIIQNQKTSIVTENQGYYLAIQTATATGIIGGSWLMIKEIEYRTFDFYRLTFEGKSLVHGFAIGIIIMIAFAFLALVLRINEFKYVGFSSKLFVSFFIYSLVAFGEEILVRGYILNNLQEKLSPFFALLLSSLFFEILHFGNDHFTWIGFGTISLSGFLMGLLTLKTSSISAAIGLHWSWNFVQGPVLGFAVSGHQKSRVLTPIAFSSDPLSGGKFGAEGSIILMFFSLFWAIGGCYFFFGKKFFFGSKRVFTNPEFSEEK